VGGLELLDVGHAMLFVPSIHACALSAWKVFPESHWALVPAHSVACILLVQSLTDV